MNYVEGQSLAHLIKERAPLSAEETLRILSPLADALDYAHARGVLHGDIKPENVIVGSEERVILTDFSIARALEGTWLTRWGVVAETPQYMSPEQATGRGIDTRSDQYSLGVLAYEMLTGRVPFYAESNVQLVHQIAYDPPPSLLGVRPDLTAELAGVVERALAKDAASRFGSCGEFVGSFSKALASAPEAEAAAEEVDQDVQVEAEAEVEVRVEPAAADEPPLMPGSGSDESSGGEGLAADRLF
jgi:serine/threonine-protein kinase